ncbi:molybdopterin-dependent oxidoreductase [Helicobacter pylori]|nr:molybdopterin-dependent oxidoreductase [Helicobacter pylori]WRA67464.1 molybdopterin-dependent oxidoreductase [Helicobacter pylori]
MSISRRSILTKIPIVLASANVLKAVGVFEKVESIPHATHFGPFIAKVQNGVIKDIVPQKSDYNPTMMLKAMADRVYSDSRVKYPCVRKSFLENKKNHKELRGREEFVRVSWDVALDLAAKKLKEIPKENIYNASYGGWGHAGSLHRCHHLAWRFFNTTLGGAIGTDGEYGNGAAARINPMISQGHNSVKSVIPASRISEAILNPDKEIDFMGKKLQLPKIKMIYNCGADLLGHEADTNELIRALRTLDCVIVHEPWWTPTAKFADIVFASTSTMERDDITFGGSYSKNVVYAMRKVVEPVYESKDDYEIFRQLALRIGGNETEQKFTESKSYMEWIKGLYEKSDGPTLKSFDQFWRDGFVEFEIPENARKFVRHAKFRQDPISNKLDTESGKIQIFSQKCADFKLADFKGHPTWFEPAEWLGSKMAEIYPFHLISPHPKYRVNSQLDNTWVRNVYKIQGREPVMINELDANKLGIRHGEIVEVFNARGRLLAGAFVTKNIRQGVLSIQKGAWYDPEDERVRNPRCNAGHVNTLTSLRPTSSMTQAISANTALVNIRRLRRYELVKPYHSISTPSIIGA